MYLWLAGCISPRMQEVGPDQLVYIDETGIDEREQYAYGWSLQGERCHAQRHGGRGHRLSLISAVRGSAPTRLIEPYVFSGHCERSWIEVWLERLCQVLPEGQKHYLILDNASFHKGGKLEEISSSYGHVLMYLPAYSPELNPIEKCWAVIKKKIRLLLSQGVELMQALEKVCSS